MVNRKMKISIMSCLILLIFISMMLFFFGKIYPLQKKVKAGAVQLANAQSLIKHPLQKPDSPMDISVTDATNLQLKVPVSPSIETFLLELEKAEAASHCQINNIIMENNTDKSNEEHANTNTQISSNDQDGQMEGGNQNVSQNENKMKKSLPEGVEQKTVKLELQAENYSQFYRFIEEIEALQRISSIDTVQFSDEDTLSTPSPNEAKQSLTVQLSISIFYYPALENLLKDTEPKMMTPNPSNKLDPLESTEIFDPTNEANIQQPTIKDGAEDIPSSTGGTASLSNDSKPKQVISHQVMPGETLYSIADKYYHSKNGEKLIADYNGLEGMTVFAGTTLKIPIY